MVFYVVLSQGSVVTVRKYLALDNFASLIALYTGITRNLSIIKDKVVLQSTFIFQLYLPTPPSQAIYINIPITTSTEKSVENHKKMVFIYITILFFLNQVAFFSSPPLVQMGLRKESTYGRFPKLASTITKATLKLTMQQQIICDCDLKFYSMSDDQSN